jgi:hypothetical protein
MGQRIFECVLSIGTRSAQSIMASGFTAAQTGRTHDRTRPMLQQLRKFLPRRRRPHMTQSGHSGCGPRYAREVVAMGCVRVLQYQNDKLFPWRPTPRTTRLLRRPPCQPAQK